MATDMLLKLKAFIYRFSAIFGLRVYLAKHEEEQFILECRFSRLAEDMIEGQRSSSLIYDLMRGIWHAQNGFTSVHARHMGFFKRIVARLKHAFFYE